jgi:hypothetical protein
VTAVADGPSGAAGNAQCARKLVERMESSSLAASASCLILADCRALISDRHIIRVLSFVLYLSLEAPIRTVDAVTEQKYPVLLEYAKASFERIKQRLRHL